MTSTHQTVFTIDAAHHMLPDFFWRKTESALAPIGGLAPLRCSKETTVLFMDDAGIDVAVVSLSTPGAHTGESIKARALAHRYNEFSGHFAASKLARCLLIVGLCLFVTGVVNAQTPDPSPVDAPQPGVRPPLSPFPRFQDWSFLRDPSQRMDPFDRLKFIPLNESAQTT